jgi:hypothetical protein
VNRRKEDFYKSTYLISIVVRRSDFNSGRKVKDDAVNAWPSLTPCSLNSLANLERKLQFCLGKCLRAVLIMEFHAV